MIKTKFSRYVAMLLALIMALSINVFASAENITFIVTGDSIHSEGGHSSYEEWINTSYELKGENVGEIMENVLAQQGYSCDYSIGEYGGYLNSITTPSGDSIGTGTNGSKSGWLFAVNDEIPAYAMDQVVPANGDVVEIFYIDDYEAEVYGYYSTINVTPTEASLVVKNTLTNEVIEPSWGSYSFFNGTYNYTASANGYVTKTEDFVVSGAGVSIDIVLEKESSSDATTESTTERLDLNADWGLFRRNTNNNGVINADTPSVANAEIKWATAVKTGWTANSGSVIANGSIYTVVGSTLNKLDVNTGEITGTSTLDKAISYTYFIAYGDGKIFVQLSDGSIQAVDSESLNKIWTSATPDGSSKGTGITPIYYNNGKVYAGTESRKADDAGYYYCINAENGEFIWTLKGGIGDYAGFYWSGCVSVGDNIVVGGEDGKLLMIDSKGSVVDTFIANGAIRSTVVYDNDSVYFTDKSGYVYSVGVNESGFTDSKFALINENSSASTSTPAVYDGKIYVGASGSVGYFSVFDTDLNQLYTTEVEGSVQSSPLVAVNGNDVKVYFTCNTSTGNLKVYTNGECSDLLDISEYKQYCIHSVIADNNGTIYYQNDSGNIVAIGKSSEATTETSSETITETVESSSEVTTDTIETSSEATTNTIETSSEATTIEVESSSETTTSNGGGGGGGGGSSKITVSFTLKGDGILLTDSNISINSNSTVVNLLKKVFDENGVTCVGLDDGYIRSLTYNGVTLSEFDKGPNSGWMFKINGEYPSVGIGNYNLSSGDRVEFVYVEDYTKENYGSSSDWEENSNTTTEMTTATTTEYSTEVTTESENATVGEKTEIVVNGETLSHNFGDIKGNHWANEAVTVLYNRGIISGKSEIIFAPNEGITRAELVSMLYRMSGDNKEYSSNFNDVNENSWYYKAVAWAYSNGIVYGISESEFAPNNKITRQDMACIVKRYADKYNIELTEKIGYSEFKDESDISSYAVESIKALYMAEIVKGNEKGEFAPINNITRAEAAVMIYNIIK